MNSCNQIFFLILLMGQDVLSQTPDPYLSDASSPKNISGFNLVWSDEFNYNGKPNPRNWKYEIGFVRNEELQWYLPDNANCMNGVLLIEGRREQVLNLDYSSTSKNWKLNRHYASYTSSSIKTQDLQHFHFGRLEIRARVDTSMGSWPAIWTLGVEGSWPLNGEVDIMEFYRSKNVPTILANLAWGKTEKGGPVWNTKTLPLIGFTSQDQDWVKKFHVWRMDWSKDSINLFLDDVLLNTGVLNRTLNPDGTNPFLKPHYLLLNLAIGGNGGDPVNAKFPIRYEVDYVRYYKQN